MKKKFAQPAVFRLRGWITLLVLAGAGCSILSGALLAFRPEAPANSSQRILTFAERVAYQRAIEEVYWRDRIWPNENAEPKPLLDAVMSQAQLEEKVGDYLRDSRLLEDYYHQPITAEQLQGEMDRMAQHTKEPEVLRELFEALGNDPFVIAECLARPILAERLLAESSARDPRLAGQLDQSFLAMLEAQMLARMPAASGNYVLPTIADPSVTCTDNTWAATSTVNAPARRYVHTAVWTGSEMIVWGGYNGGFFLKTGGRYTPSTDSWTATSTMNAPSERYGHTAVWTGSTMLIWGGSTAYSHFNSGGRYSPSTDSWTPTSLTSAPAARSGHTAVWTGSEMIVWGGFNGSSLFNTGGRYNPGSDRWTITSITNAPSRRELHTAVWTGSQMIVWGGTNAAGGTFHTGGRYNPSANSWTDISTTGAPAARYAHSAVWTGSHMIVWGGYTGSSLLNTGGRYRLGNDSWSATSTNNAPLARRYHTAVWTTSEMIVWGGDNNGGGFFRTGARYRVLTDSWRATSTAGAPSARESHTAVRIGTNMFIWGGYNGGPLNSGGRYCAGTPSPTPR